MKPRLYVLAVVVATGCLGVVLGRATAPAGHVVATDVEAAPPETLHVPVLADTALAIGIAKLQRKVARQVDTVRVLVPVRVADTTAGRWYVESLLAGLGPSDSTYVASILLRGSGPRRSAMLPTPGRLRSVFADTSSVRLDFADPDSARGAVARAVEKWRSCGLPCDLGLIAAGIAVGIGVSQ